MSCEGGIRRRTRNCVNGEEGDPGCPGADSEFGQCADQVSLDHDKLHFFETTRYLHHSVI